MIELDSLRKADLQWTTHVESIWSDPEHDVAGYHGDIRARLYDEVSTLKEKGDVRSPLGVILLGSAGTGKTHLLSALRQYAQQKGVPFLLIDMTDVRRFWRTVVLGLLHSLQRETPRGELPFRQLVDFLVQGTGIDAQTQAHLESPQLVTHINQVLQRLASKNRMETLQHQDTIRALLLLNSEDFSISNLGSGWLQGIALESEEDRARYGFQKTSFDAMDAARGLLCLIGWWAPAVLAFDQLDAIVAENSATTGNTPDEALTSEQRSSRRIIGEIGDGLMALRDLTRRSLLVVSSLESTWVTLKRCAVTTAFDRFREPMLLHPLSTSSMARELVSKRLAASFAVTGFMPPFSTWPFREPAFEETVFQSPRELLKFCDAHRRACLSRGKVTILKSFKDIQSEHEISMRELEKLDRNYEALRLEVPLQRLSGPDGEDELGKLLSAASSRLVHENELPDHVDLVVDQDFHDRAYPSLHARIRRIDRNDNDRERHYSMRVLEHTHASSFKARLAAAMTSSGIDRDLGFRRLRIYRANTSIPSTALTQMLLGKFKERGGVLTRLNDKDIRSLWALQQMESEQPEHFSKWLKKRRPSSELAVLREAVEWIFGTVPAARGEAAQKVVRSGPTEGQTQGSGGATIAPPVQSQDATSPATGSKLDGPGIGASPAKQGELDFKVSRPPGPDIDRTRMPFGRKIYAGKAREEMVSTPLDALMRHVVVLASAGSGKTVLVKRLIEEAAIRGVSSLVIDGANDLSLLGARWPEAPSTWAEGDAALADFYHENVDVEVWTPGKLSGRPLSLAQLPDFSALNATGSPEEVEEFEEAVLMARESLAPALVGGGSAAEVKKGILHAVLRHFAIQRGGSLADLAALLKDLPPQVAPGFGKPEKHAAAMADLLAAQMQTDPLSQPGAPALDFAHIFAVGRSRPRVSVMNLCGLPSTGLQQRFVNQLAMTLFTWIKKNPARGGLGRLMVVDEAKDFVPSQGGAVSGPSLIRLTAQARKYGLGLVFATQAPKSIDHNVIANCTTQIYGRASSPAAIDVIEEQIRLRQGTASDIARLDRGQFYIHSEGMAAPVRVQTSLCLSHHPTNAPTEAEVIAIAKRFRT